MTAHTEPGVRSWYYKACCSGCGNVNERGPFVSRYKPDDVVELVCQVCMSAPYRALIEQRDRAQSQLIAANERAEAAEDARDRMREALERATAELRRYVDLQTKLGYFEYALRTEGEIVMLEAAIKIANGVSSV